MSNLTIKQYNPDTAVAIRYSQEDWANHETRIRELHADRYTQQQIREMLRTDCGCGNVDCGFRPS